jgi:hypothetical protein
VKVADSSFEFKIVGDENAKSFVEMIERWKAATEDNNRLLRESIELQKRFTEQVNNTSRARKNAQQQAQSQQQQSNPSVVRDPVSGQWRRAPSPRTYTQGWETVREGPTWRDEKGRFQRGGYSTFKGPGAPNDEHEKQFKKYQESLKVFHQDTNSWTKALPELGRIALKLYALNRVFGGKSTGGVGAGEKLLFGSVAFGLGSNRGGGGLIGALFGINTANKIANVVAGRAAAEGVAGAAAGGAAAAAGEIGLLSLVTKALGPVTIALAAIAEVTKLTFEQYNQVAQGAVEPGRVAFRTGIGVGDVRYRRGAYAQEGMDADNVSKQAAYAQMDANSKAFIAYSMAGIDPHSENAPQKLLDYWNANFKGLGPATLPTAEDTGFKEALGENAIMTGFFGRAARPEDPSAKLIGGMNISDSTKNAFEESLTKIAEMQGTATALEEKVVSITIPAVDAALDTATGGLGFLSNKATEAGNALGRLADLLKDKPAEVRDKPILFLGEI